MNADYYFDRQRVKVPCQRKLPAHRLVQMLATLATTDRINVHLLISSLFFHAEERPVHFSKSLIPFPFACHSLILLI
jgi:hypothetical protein